MERILPPGADNPNKTGVSPNAADANGAAFGDKTAYPPLFSISRPELRALLTTLGEPPFRTAQVYDWLRQGVAPDQMRNVPKALREKLSAYPLGGVTIYKKLTDPVDGTNKYLFLLEDGNLVEGVLMRYHHGNTLCISTQVGCNMGCSFCASTLDGCARNLTTSELISQITAVARDEGKPEVGRAVTNVVLMGSGEPLDNYDNVLAFLWRLVGQDGLGVSPRNVSLSTCGLVPKIYRFMEEAPAVTLSISLHAHDNETRSRLMPVNRRYPIEQVVEAARAYAQKSGRRVIFEYALIAGINDRPEDAAALKTLLGGMLCHVNLIPLNSVKERNLAGSSRQQAQLFCKQLNDLGLSATVRREMGSRLDGACGQLRRHVLEKGDAL